MYKHKFLIIYTQYSFIRLHCVLQNEHAIGKTNTYKLLVSVVMSLVSNVSGVVVTSLVCKIFSRTWTLGTFCIPTLLAKGSLCMKM